MVVTNDLFFNKVLMEAVKETVFIIQVGNDSEFYFDFLNCAAMERMGLSQNVLGQSVRNVFPDVAGILYKQYQKVVTSHESVTYVDSYESPLGTPQHFLDTRLIPIFDELDKCTHIIGHVTDITEKRQTKIELKENIEKLTESRRRYRSLFDFNSDAIFSLNVKGQILRGNAAVKSIIRYEPGDLIDSDFTSLFETNDVDMIKGYFQQALSGIPAEYSTSLVNRTGETIKLLVKFTPIIINNKVIGVFAVLKDVTEIFDLAKKYKESEQRFRIIAKNAHDLITLLDYKGEIIYASPSYKSILGFDPEEYIGKLFFHNVHHDYINELENNFSMSLKNRQPFNVQFMQKSKMEEWKWYESNVTPVLMTVINSYIWLLLRGTLI